MSDHKVPMALTLAGGDASVTLDPCPPWSQIRELGAKMSQEVDITAVYTFTSGSWLAGTFVKGVFEPSQEWLRS